MEVICFLFPVAPERDEHDVRVEVQTEETKLEDKWSWDVFRHANIQKDSVCELDQIIYCDALRTLQAEDSEAGCAEQIMGSSSPSLLKLNVFKLLEKPKCFLSKALA